MVYQVLKQKVMLEQVYGREMFYHYFYFSAWVVAQ